jgi:Ca2+-transporting ATPase
MAKPHLPSLELKGLSRSEIPELQNRYGRNSVKKERQGFWIHLKEVVGEPMFILLLAACIIYLIIGQFREGLMTIVAIILVGGISIYQGVRSSKALAALKDLTEPKVKVIRDGIEIIISSIDLVPGDIAVMEEGEKVPADAIIIQQNDLSINESVITGESLPIDKQNGDTLFQGSVIQSGMCYARVCAIGAQTELGKIGKSVESYLTPKTILQVAIARFVKRLALFGVLAFLIIWIINYIKSGDILTSLLFGLTLTMAAIPEEIPVAFSSFMALGAYRMSRLGIITRQPAVIENLGAVSVICLDKTGTITENKMKVSSLYDHSRKKVVEPQACEVLEYAMLASESSPFDSMEKAILQCYDELVDGNIPSLVCEYPLEEHPPMMTHVYGTPGNYRVAAKGAPERIMEACKLSGDEYQSVRDITDQMASLGQRVIAVAAAEHETGLPSTQFGFKWRFIGLLSLFDPPKKGVDEVFRQINEAGISIKLVTGDHGKTALNIAQQVGIQNSGHFLEGKDVIKMDLFQLGEAARKVTIFARMFPEAKLKLIEALKQNGEIVAMTGDGVNDGPALKASHIGIAMGHRGTQIARLAADLILTDDNLHKISEAIRQGRRIYTNLKKAILYIISIHIPIILTASLPLIFNWKYPNIFTPIHVIFLELIMGPTCSIFFENEPETAGIMSQPPRKRSIGIFAKDEMWQSITMGLVISIGTLTLYYLFSGIHPIEQVRSIVFSNLLISNILLTFTTRSFTETINKTIQYKNNLAAYVILASVSLLTVIHVIPGVRSLFGMATIRFSDFVLCILVSMVSVGWFELYKKFFRQSGD